MSSAGPGSCRAKAASRLCVGRVSCRDADSPASRGSRSASAMPRPTGSLTRRMIGISALWIVLLLGVGGYRARPGADLGDHQQFRRPARLCADRDDRLVRDRPGRRGPVQPRRPPTSASSSPIRASISRSSGRAAAEPFPSRSLWDRRLDVAPHIDTEAHYYDSDEFPGEKLRIIERDVRLPGSPVRWRFQVAQSRDDARRADRRAAADHGPLVRRARPRPHPARRDPGAFTACGRCAASAARSPRSARAASRGSRSGCRARSSR